MLAVLQVVPYSSGFRRGQTPPRFPAYGPFASQFATEHTAGEGDCLKVPLFHSPDEPKTAQLMPPTIGPAARRTRGRASVFYTTRARACTVPEPQLAGLRVAQQGVMASGDLEDQQTERQWRCGQCAQPRTSAKRELYKCCYARQPGCPIRSFSSEIEIPTSSI